jgi:hypothetical protein
MKLVEETIDATLDSNGQLQLSHPPHLPAGRVQVTIRVSTPTTSRRGLVDLLREIAAEQRARGFPGRSAQEIRDEDDSRQHDNSERDRELDSARRVTH